MSKWLQCLEWIPYPSFFRRFLGLINKSHQFISDVIYSFMLRLPALSLPAHHFLLFIAVSSCSWSPLKATSYPGGHQLSLHSPKAHPTLDSHFSQFFVVVFLMTQRLGEEITVLNKLSNVLLAAYYRIPDSEVQTIIRSKVECSKAWLSCWHKHWHEECNAFPLSSSVGLAFCSRLAILICHGTPVLV